MPPASVGKPYRPSSAARRYGDILGNFLNVDSRRARTTQENDYRQRMREWDRDTDRLIKEERESGKRWTPEEARNRRHAYEKERLIKKNADDQYKKTLSPAERKAHEERQQQYNDLEDQQRAHEIQNANDDLKILTEERLRGKKLTPEEKTKFKQKLADERQQNEENRQQSENYRNSLSPRDRAAYDEHQANHKRMMDEWEEDSDRATKEQIALGHAWTPEESKKRHEEYKRERAEKKARQNPAQKQAGYLSKLLKRPTLSTNTLSNTQDNTTPSSQNQSGQLGNSSSPVTDAAKLGNPYGDRPMSEKSREAAERQRLFSGEDSSPPNNSSSSTEPGSTESTNSLLERGRGTLGQEYGKFQRDLQATKRRDDLANANKLKALAASKGSQTLKQVNMLKERIEKIRDLFSLGTGVGVFYYIAKLDITIANRYFLKRTYLWGYREKEEYEGNKFLRFNDNLDLIEWCGWMFIRVIMTLAPVMILFIWVILPVLAAHELANRILGPTLAGYLMRIIH